MNKDKTMTKSSSKPAATKKTKAPKAPIQLGRLVSKLLYRFHIVIFVVVVLGGLAVVIFILNQTLSRATDISDTSSSTASGFDVDTIERLNELSSGTNNQLQLPGGRTNPFSE